MSGILAVGAAAPAGLGLGWQDRMEQQLNAVNRSVAEEQTRRAVLKERTRIVAELHDIIANTCPWSRYEPRPRRIGSPRSGPRRRMIR